MTELDNIVKNVLRITELPFDVQTFYAALRELSQAGIKADIPERNQALHGLVPIIETSNTLYAALTALTCGTLVEDGGDPDITAAAIVMRATDALMQAKDYADACEQEQLDPFDQDTMQRFGPEIPHAVDAWNMLEYLYRASIAMLSRSKAARIAARQTPELLPAAGELKDVHHGADWLYKMLMVLDDEEIIVLHPEQKRGYRIRISGIADNFQLHLLLADRLTGNPAEGWLSGTKPDRAVMGKMLGDMNTDELTATGTLNLVNYTGLLPDGSISSEHGNWIWGEGIPADILPFEGTRIILLDKPPYQRSWNAQRMFEGLRPEFQVVQSLSEAEFTTWMQRLKDASAGKHQA